jgi:adenylate kinase
LTFPAPIGTVLWMRIVLMGAPGSGKGTQSQRLVQRFGIPQISTGDLLRSAVARGTDYGRRAKAAMDAGMLVVDEIVLGIIRERLGESDAARGFILDGFPRNLAQAQALQTMLTGIGSSLDAVVLFEVDYAEIIKRISGRRSCPQCARVFNAPKSEPGSPARCDQCADHPALVQRPDDEEATVRRRLEVYERETRPLAQYYAGQGLLQTIDADAPMDEVTSRLLAALAAVPSPLPLKAAAQTNPS